MSAGPFAAAAPGPSDTMASMSPRSAAVDDTTSGTLARGLTILEFVADKGRVGVGEIAAELGISRSAAYRLVSQLRDRRFLAEPHEGAGLQLGGKSIRLGLRALGSADLLQLAAVRLRHLVADVRETAFLATVDYDAVVYVLQEVGPSAVTMTARPGNLRPLYCTGLGKAYLSALPAADRDSIVSRLTLRPVTARTITDVDTLRAELDVTATRGYAIDNGELEPEVRCIAAPVLDHGGRPIAAISVGGPTDRILAREDVIASALLATAGALSQDLGAPGPRSP